MASEPLTCVLRQSATGGCHADSPLRSSGFRTCIAAAGVVDTLAAVEMLLADGFRPFRTVLFAYGHDEEIGGAGGAREIAALLKRRGVRLEMVLDEGGVIGDGVLAGIREPIALVGVAEKGFVTIELTARTPGGHSSLPPAHPKALSSLIH